MAAKLRGSSFTDWRNMLIRRASFGGHSAAHPKQSHF
jgi:hypothetical protein